MVAFGRAHTGRVPLSVGPGDHDENGRGGAHAHASDSVNGQHASSQAARVHLFGGCWVEREGWAAPVRFARAAETLLSYLVLHRQTAHARDELAGLFWGQLSEDRARNCLNTTLWRIRRVLEPDAASRGSLITTLPSGDVRFSPACECWIDVAVFEEALDELLVRAPEDLTESDVERLETAIGLYTGDVLVGVFEDWALIEREHLRARHIAAQMHVLAAHRAHGDLQRSLTHARRVVSAEPLREEVHRQLIGLYRDAGQPADARRQYEACRTILHDELGIVPAAETQALVSLLDAPRPRSAPAHDPTAELHHALDLVQRAASALRDAERRLSAAITTGDISASASRNGS
jgi:DNA-binding SARP family transcriptional activator